MAKSSLGAELFQRRYDAYYVWFGCLFSVALVLTNIIGVKLFYAFRETFPNGLGWGAFTLTSGIITYPVTFLVTDVVSEIWGKRKADLLVVIGFAMSFFMLVLVQLAGALEPSHIWSSSPQGLKTTRVETELNGVEFARLERGLRAVCDQAAAERPDELKSIQRWEEDDFAARGIRFAVTGNSSSGAMQAILVPSESGGLLEVIDDGEHEDPSGALRWTRSILNGLGLPQTVEPGDERPSAWSIVSMRHKQLAYDDTFRNPAILIFASMLAYLIAQLFDVRLFHFWRKLTKGRHMWIRNNGSTFISQLVDTIIVNSIFLYFAFGLDADTITKIILANYMFKAALAILDTPIVYLFTWWVKRRLGFQWSEHVVPV